MTGRLSIDKGGLGGGSRCIEVGSRRTSSSSPCRTGNHRVIGTLEDVDRLWFWGLVFRPVVGVRRHAPDGRSGNRGRPRHSAV